MEQTLCSLSPVQNPDGSLRFLVFDPNGNPQEQYMTLEQVCEFCKGSGQDFTIGGQLYPAGTDLESLIAALNMQVMSIQQNGMVGTGDQGDSTTNAGNGAPSGAPTNGNNFYYDLTNDDLYFWNGIEWELVSSGTSGTGDPDGSTSTTNPYYFNTTTNQLWFWNGTEWTLVGGDPNKDNNYFTASSEGDGRIVVHNGKGGSVVEFTESGNFGSYRRMGRLSGHRFSSVENVAGVLNQFGFMMVDHDKFFLQVQNATYGLSTIDVNRLTGGIEIKHEDGTTNTITALRLVDGKLFLDTANPDALGYLRLQADGSVEFVDAAPNNNGGGNTDLGVANRNASTLDVTSSTGNNTTIPAATDSQAGLMSSADKLKLNGLQNADGSETIISQGANVTVTGDGTMASPYVIAASGGGGASITDLGIANRNSDTLDVTSSDGADTTIPAATDAQAGLMSADDKLKLDGLSNSGLKWYNSGLNNIYLYASADPTTWIGNENAAGGVGAVGEFRIVVPAGEVLDRIRYVTNGGTTRNATNNQTNFYIDTSATPNTNTSTLTSSVPSVTMVNTAGNTVPVGIGGSPSVITPIPTTGVKTITIQGTTGVSDGISSIQINNLDTNR